MAHLHVNFFSYLFVILLVSNMNTVTFVRGQKRIVDLCNKTRDPSFCMGVLRTRGNADMFVIAMSTIDLASTRSSDTVSIVRALRLSTTKADLRYYLEMCESSYRDVLVYLSNGRDSLKKGDYHNVNILASGVNDKVAYCEMALNAPPFKSPLTKVNNDLQTLADIVAVAANSLGGKK